MHGVISHGAPKIMMNSQEADYQERLRQARAQGDGNPYTSGIQAQPVADSFAESPASAPAPAPETLPQEPNVGTGDLDKRLALYAKAAGNADFGNNNRSETMRID
jgi:hypothetical protein